jgi:DNA-binding PadR family transcriptional regulator
LHQRGEEIDIDALVRIADLFRLRWDPAVLAVLAERPSRYRALHTRLESHVGEHVDDNALTRCLQRATRSGLIRADSKRLGSRIIKTYALTERGRDQLMTYEAIVAVYAHVHMPESECDGGCSVHTSPQAERAA